MERMLRDRYFALVDEIVAHLDGTNLEAAAALASYPDEIRGYGSVKDQSAKRAEARVEALHARFSGVSPDSYRPLKRHEGRRQ
jgi:indolepyruvate ferredoxin oxidoreductase